MHRHAVMARDYILGHAGRQLRLGPIAFWIAVGALVIMGVWTIATATYFAFREDVLTRLIGRQAEMQFAYEDRVADLRAQIDRITSRQLLDQEQFEQKLEQLMRRQAVLESRSSTLSAAADPMLTGSIKLAPRSGGADLPAARLPKPSPISDTKTFSVPPERKAWIAPSSASGAGTAKPAGVHATLARLQTSLDHVERQQYATLGALEESYSSRAHRMRSVLADFGLNPGKAPSVFSRSGTGGPFVPAKPRGEAGAFEHQLYRINLARAHVDELSRTLVTVPLRKPVTGEIDLSSGFGMRIDPFLHTPAMHTGLDFRGDMGDPIRATAAGKVTHAGWNGGYGKMVEIDHGNGFSTRYGHLSEIGVSAGQLVRTGQIIGRIGSSGRSTGPHLHYETRVEGEATNPQKFLRAGDLLGGIL
ncbi:MAG: M23 family metallopeptidase [Xanthobacteraceae bacterium]